MLVAKRKGPRNTRERVTMEGRDDKPWKELPATGQGE